MSRTFGQDGPEPRKVDPPDERSTWHEQGRNAQTDAQVVTRLRHVIDWIARDQPSMPEFFECLKKAGIQPVPSMQKTGRLNGISYEMGGLLVKGSHLGRAYTAQGLIRR